MSFRWNYIQPEHEEAISRLQKELGVPESIARLLSIRGIKTFEDARQFFRPDLESLHDPFLMKGMETGAERLAAAIRNSEKVVVYGDYDVDGTTATAIMHTFLKNFGLDVHFYIPHRFKEGYGIGRDGIDYAESIGAGLIVSVDCGITAVEETEYARSKGIELIICDHHNAGDKIPDAVAVLDPKQPGCPYPFKGLSGAGVGFKLIQATLVKLGLPPNVAHPYLDLVAISIASDIVPIVDENRILMREGLDRINKNPRAGIKALLDRIQLRGPELTTSHIVFSLGPRINAAGRMGDAAVAVALLISETPEEAGELASRLEKINLQRRSTDTRTMDEALKQIDGDSYGDAGSCLVLHDPDWHLGVIGIVASRLVDIYCRPTIMLSTVDGQIKGSARSINGFNIYDALKKCDDLLVQFGGHKYAAGLTIEEDQLEEFIKRFHDITGEMLSEQDFNPELLIDTELSLNEITQRFWKLLKQFEPFGPNNLKPIFVSRDVNLNTRPMIVGQGHLKMRISQSGAPAFEAIGFNMEKYAEPLRNAGSGSVDIAYTIEENTWNNKTSLQLRLKDIHIGGEQVPAAEKNNKQVLSK
ncbi:single-stranded-DNA-specific exonuclease RecJ [Natronogracilivirga saccharolytica]|uniref:Single-stranded-DNA-specific exonuclease RecJ n=1 Tax=Natronogracilivirga saccharolytica TaxID=2812953 RepID=A0A8J7USN5_9BACT|nr:single-stranded-DNA-specific exonuclease RecJ [Natronogracilivirga saccharolytica]MBP3191706.1 single-stranded-DNA-specific exonuclease RecJ [Natronogracilivirga saccharolytica]